MRDWFRQFLSMPDEERAKLLAQISACAIIVLLYILGGFSLYLRTIYLQPAATAAPKPTPAADRIATVSPAKTLQPVKANSAEVMTPTPTLYPTITPEVTKAAKADPCWAEQSDPYDDDGPTPILRPIPGQLPNA